MNTRKIYDSDISSLKVSSLPTRPTAPTAFGGKGYTATEMKEAFDKLPLYIIDHFNTLVGEIENGSLAQFLSNLEPFSSMLSDIELIKAKLEL
jgi:hypothetical protein